MKTANHSLLTTELAVSWLTCTASFIFLAAVLIGKAHNMRWLEQKIRRYEHRRWSADNTRRILPFAWGTEHVGGRSHEPNPRYFFRDYARESVSHSDEWFSCEPPRDFLFEASQEGDFRSGARGIVARGTGMLRFTSGVRSPWAENNRVAARFFPARGQYGKQRQTAAEGSAKKGPAVIVLPQWNADANGHVDICLWLNKLGLSALRLTLPYHDERGVPEQPRAEHIVGPNIGLTLQANRQAVCDVRCCVLWLAENGFGPIGILGSSLGSCISCIATAHEPLIRAAALLHVSSYFGDVVANGLTTINVWESLRTAVSVGELREFWMPISPIPYIPKLRGTGQKLLAISGRYDATFWNEFSDQFFATVEKNGVDCRTLRLPCGHYSLGEAPFKWIAGWRAGKFLQRALR